MGDFGSDLFNQPVGFVPIKDRAIKAFRSQGNASFVRPGAKGKLLYDLRVCGIKTIQ